MTARARTVARRVACWGTVIAAGTMGASGRARAQAWNYPAFQQSHIVNREFNFGVADAGNAGTVLVGQWREQVSSVEQLSLDGGVALGNGNSAVFAGGQYAFQFTNETATNPFELLGVGGVNLAFVSHDVLLRLPAGVSIGHAFPIAEGMAVTPFVLPRVELDFCTECGMADRGRAELGIGSDFGLNLDVTRQFSLRMAVAVGGTTIFSHENSYGISVAWRPSGLMHH